MLWCKRCPGTNVAYFLIVLVTGSVVWHCAGQGWARPRGQGKEAEQKWLQKSPAPSALSLTQLESLALSLQLWFLALQQKHLSTVVFPKRHEMSFLWYLPNVGLWVQSQPFKSRWCQSSCGWSWGWLPESREGFSVPIYNLPLGPLSNSLLITLSTLRYKQLLFIECLLNKCKAQTK